MGIVAGVDRVRVCGVVFRDRDRVESEKLQKVTTVYFDFAFFNCVRSGRADLRFSFMFSFFSL